MKTKTKPLGIFALIALCVQSGSVSLYAAPRGVDRANNNGYDDCLVDLTAFEKCEKDGRFEGAPKALVDYLRGQADENGKRKAADIEKAKREEELRKWQQKVEDVASKSRFTLIHQRCPDDSLAGAAAVGRTRWALKCMPFLKEEMRNALTNALAKERPEYPTFAAYTGPDSYGPSIPMPTDPEAGCEALKEGYYIKNMCMSGCYTPDQRVMFIDGYREIGITDLDSASHVITLNAQSTLENPSVQVSSVERYIKTSRSVEEPIVVIETQAGRRVEVTTDHPMMTLDGRMVRAKDLQPGQLLAALKLLPTMQIEGDEIIALSQRMYFGRVFNIDVDSDRLAENVVVAEGLLSGTLKLQNSSNETLNRVLLRENLGSRLSELVQLTAAQK